MNSRGWINRAESSGNDSNNKWWTAAARLNGDDKSRAGATEIDERPRESSALVELSDGDGGRECRWNWMTEEGMDIFQMPFLEFT